MQKILIISGLVSMFACAQIPPLTGGPKDTTAPIIDSAKTYPYNGQINYQHNVIQIKFKEFVSLNKPLENIIITPQQTENPLVTSNKKKVRIELVDDMTANTTYSITFNHAVQDITERNDSVFQYVFSTGSYIDSLYFSGFILDAFTNKPLKNMLIGLYPDNIQDDYDSIPFYNKPMYLSQSNAKGEFKLDYLKDGDYYMFAFLDKNRDLYYQADEKVAFTSQEKIRIIESIDGVELRAFDKVQSDCRIENTSFSFPGRFSLTFSNDPDTISITSNLDLLQEDTGREDSLIFWLSDNPVPKMRFYINLNGENDTLKPVYENIPDKIETVEFKVSHNVLGGKLFPKENLIYQFTEPIRSIDTTGIMAFDIDSNKIQLPIFNIETRKLTFETLGTDIYEIRLDSAAVKSVYGRELNEDLSVKFENREMDYFGSLIINTDTVFTTDILAALLDDKGNVFRDFEFSEKVILEELLPGDYQLRLILDEDGNGEWTSGNIKEKVQPEKVIYYIGTVKVKSKWEKEVDWNLRIE